MELPFAESWKIKMVEPIRKSTRAEREQWLKEAKNNIFMLRSEQVYIDLLTDSGTGAMSDRQWAALMLGDESYSGSKSFFELKDTIQRITGFNYVIPTHQGRAAENVLFSHLVKEGQVIPGNAHFDTTKGHIEARRAHAIDVTIKEAENDGDGLNFLAGKDMFFVNEKAFQGTVLAHTDGGVPNFVISVAKPDAYNLGELIYFFEKACAISGYMLGVNPFNQPGVESYKKNMFALLGKPGYEEMKQKLEARLG